MFEGFERPRPSRPTSWEGLEKFLHHGRRFATERSQEFPGLLRQWDECLADLEGDPSRADWTTFRPLRSSREEDWSDWLQHFIATSVSGSFSYQIFGRKQPVWLEFGLWWRDGEVAYYCGFVDARNKAIQFTYHRNHPRIEFCKWSKKARLFMLSSKTQEPELESELKIIVDELVESVRSDLSDNVNSEM